MADAPSDDPLAETLTRLAAFLPRLSGRLTVDGPLGRVALEAKHDTVVVNLAEVPDLGEVKALFARPPGPERAAPDPGEPSAAGEGGGSKREAAARARERTRLLAGALDAAGLTLEIRVGGDPLAVVGRSADPGVITRALGLGKIDLSGRTAFKLARELLG